MSMQEVARFAQALAEDPKLQRLVRDTTGDTAESQRVAEAIAAVAAQRGFRFSVDEAAAFRASLDRSAVALSEDQLESVAGGAVQGLQGLQAMGQGAAFASNLAQSIRDAWPSGR